MIVKHIRVGPIPPRWINPVRLRGLTPTKQRGTISRKNTRPKTRPSGGFLEGGENPDTVVSVRREEVGVDCELVPIIQEITDGVSS